MNAVITEEEMIAEEIKLKRQEYEADLAAKRAKKLGRGSILLQRNQKLSKTSEKNRKARVKRVLAALK